MENSFIIENLLEQQEGNRLEFKATVNKEAIAKTITGILGDSFIIVNILNCKYIEFNLNCSFFLKIKECVEITTNQHCKTNVPFISISIT